MKTYWKLCQIGLESFRLSQYAKGQCGLELRIVSGLDKMSNQYRNWTAEAAFLRKQANRIAQVLASLDEDESEETLMIAIDELRARADSISKPQKDKPQ